MQRTFYKKTALLLLAVAALSLMPVYGLDYTPATLTMDVFPDGSVAVEYRVEPDPTLVKVNVTLPGSDYVDLLVTDSTGLILDWSMAPDGIEVDTLGSDEVTISYSTQSLTNKTGSMWSLTVNATVNPILTLPTGAVLVGLTPTPNDIFIVNNRVAITMPAGASRVSYLLGTTGTREHALVLLIDAEKAVNEAKLQGFIVGDAEAALTQARDAYDAGQYSQSEQLSTQASRLARDAAALAGQAMTAIHDAESLLHSKTGLISQETLNTASDLIDTASEDYEAGDYTSAISGAGEAYTMLDEAEPKDSGTTVMIAGAALVVLAAAGYIFLRRRGSPQLPPRPDEPAANVDLDAVFKARPNLRTDDKAMLRFIQERGGVFATEARDHFNIPKSSAWRMIKRLEEEGLLRVTTVGRETYLQLREPEGSP
ncbi:MAG TPA: hypothetical protein VGB32_13195 [Candidatus Bathyarchaeia archaeon]